MTQEQMVGQPQIIKPIQKPNQVHHVMKNADGSLTCYQNSGNEFTIPASEDLMQAFVVYTMMRAECRA